MLYTLLTDSNTAEKINIHTNLQSSWRRNISNAFNKFAFNHRQNFRLEIFEIWKNRHLQQQCGKERIRLFGTVLLFSQFPYINKD